MNPGLRVGQAVYAGCKVKGDQHLNQGKGPWRKRSPIGHCGNE